MIPQMLHLNKGLGTNITNMAPWRIFRVSMKMLMKTGFGGKELQTRHALILHLVLRGMFHIAMLDPLIITLKGLITFLTRKLEHFPFLLHNRRWTRDPFQNNPILVALLDMII